MSRESFDFEDRVRRVAEAVWGLEPGACQPAWYSKDPVIHELDGLAQLRDITHVVMATTDTRLEKVRGDVAKLLAAKRIEARRNVPVEMWLITESQLNAEHVQHAKRNAVRILTLNQFRDRFFDGQGYILKRRTAPFGSARNLVDGSVTVPEDEYVAAPMTITSSDPKGVPAVGASDVADLARRLTAGEAVVMTAPFGAGKSLTTREIFAELSKVTRRNSGAPVPVAINLREHWGAQFGDEILERHARSIGFAPRDDLTSAWRAGIAVLLLDGFDELASQVVARPNDTQWMQQARYVAVQGVRDLVANQPAGSGILLAGRNHYFDDEPELRRALGLLGRPYEVVRIDEFSEDQAREYLRRHAPGSELPDWLPRKPLMLGYLAHRGLLHDALAIDGSRGFGYVWDAFLTLVCEREAAHAKAVMDPLSVRRVLERLATAVRGTVSGVGPLTALDISEAYRAESGEPPSEGVLMQLQRLPGLTPRDQDPNSRSFVDQDFLEALQGSAVARSVSENVAISENRRLLDGLGRDAIRMAAHILREQGFSGETVIATAGRLAQGDRSVSADQLAADAAMVAVELARDATVLDAHGLALNDASMVDLDIEEMRVLNLSIKNSVVHSLVLGPESPRSSIRIVDSHVGRVSGVPSEPGLPTGMFSGCTFGSFDDASTNAAILRLDLSASMKALLTILRKLYLQAGGGRKLAALSRGLPDGPVSRAVGPVLAIMESENLIYTISGVVHPVRRQADRIRRVLEAGDLSDDPLVARVRALTTQT